MTGVNTALEGFGVSRLSMVTINCEKHGVHDVFVGRYAGNTIGGHCPYCAKDEQDRIIAEEAAEQARIESDPDSITLSRLKAAGVPEDHINCRFSNFTDTDETIETSSFAKQVANGHKRSIVLLGPTGTGKTHIACAILALATRTDRSILYTKEPRILRQIRSSFNRKTGLSEDAIFQSLVDPDVLVIDELSDEPMSKFETTTIEDLIDERISKGKSTVLISNAAVEAYKVHLSDKVRSRLAHNGATFVITGEDYRRRR